MSTQLLKLKEYLNESNWKQADEQTKWVLLEAVGKDEGYFTPEDIDKVS